MEGDNDIAVAMAAEALRAGEFSKAIRKAREIDDQDTLLAFEAALDLARDEIRKARKPPLGAKARLEGALEKLSRCALSREPLNGELEEVEALAKEFYGGQDGSGPDASWRVLTGSPILDAAELLKLKDMPVAYVVEPIVISECLTQIHGPAKGGKSVFALYLATAAAFGKFPEGSPVKVAGPVKTLYLSWEDSPGLLARRICQYSEGLGVGQVIPDALRVCYAPTIGLESLSSVEVLEREVVSGGYGLIVVDTLSYIHGVNEDKASEIKAVMAALRKIARNAKCGIIYIHHRRKDQEGISLSERARGSSAIAAAADVIVDWGDRGESNVTPVGVLSKWGHSASWEVEYQTVADDEVRWEVRTKERQASRTERVEMVVRTVLALQGQSQDPPNGMQIAAIMEHQGQSKRSVYRYLGEAVKQGKLSATPKGSTMTYSVVPQTML